ncbi:hypothetical protein BJ742DRAFT_786768 [Cladochytrium replicatum]|nr:hypothetical protein BJ742DRAFT_786768 [Cladochytrium replicatum]
MSHLSAWAFSSFFQATAADRIPSIRRSSVESSDCTSRESARRFALFSGSDAFANSVALSGSIVLRIDSSQRSLPWR